MAWALWTDHTTTRRATEGVSKHGEAREPPSFRLAALSASEKAAVLDDLLATRADLRQLAETPAVQHLQAEDRAAVANQVAGALRDLYVEELNSHAGYRPGRG